MLFLFTEAILEKFQVAYLVICPVFIYNKIKRKYRLFQEVMTGEG